MESNVKLRLLGETLRTPWLSINQLAMRTGLEAAVIASLCRELVQRGLLVTAEQALSGYPHVRHAPTVRAVNAVAQLKSLTPDHLASVLGLTSERYWALRISMALAQEAVAILGATVLQVRKTRDLAGYPTHTIGLEEADFELFIERHFKEQPIFLHGKLLLYSGEQVRPYWLLVDRGEGSVWQWYPQLRTLNLSARQAHCPTLLIVTTRPQRVRAMLALARVSGSHVLTYATAERETALRRGLLAIPTWQTLSADRRIEQVALFALSGVEQEAFAKSGHAILTLDQIAATKRRKKTQGIEGAWSCPVDVQALEAFEQLGDRAHRILNFLARNPACPISIIATFCEMTKDDTAIVLTELLTAGFAYTLNAPVPEPLWAATERATQMQLRREMQPSSLAKRYHFFCADHERRGLHTLTAYRFFEALKKTCQARSCATRKLDTRPNTVNDGVIPYYELATFESEFIAAEWYRRDGQMRYWRPDGYGALRAGAAFTRFWLEIDGTALAPSRCDASVWREKISHLCDYLQSGRWTLRYETQPCLLVVTTDITNRRLLVDAVHAIARGRGITLPQVYLTTHQAVAQRGALGKIWHDITRTLADTGDEMGYAFVNAQPIHVRPHSQRMGNG